MTTTKFDVYELTDGEEVILFPMVEKDSVLKQLYKRVEEIEHVFACKDHGTHEEDLLRDELGECERIIELLIEK